MATTDVKTAIAPQVVSTGTLLKSENGKKAKIKMNADQKTAITTTALTAPITIGNTTGNVVVNNNITVNQTQHQSVFSVKNFFDMFCTKIVGTHLEPIAKFYNYYCSMCPDNMLVCSSHRFPAELRMAGITIVNKTNKAYNVCGWTTQMPSRHGLETSIIEAKRNSEAEQSMGIMVGIAKNHIPITEVKGWNRIADHVANNESTKILDGFMIHVKEAMKTDINLRATFANFFTEYLHQTKLLQEPDYVFETVKREFIHYALITRGLYDGNIYEFLNAKIESMGLSPMNEQLLLLEVVNALSKAEDQKIEILKDLANLGLSSRQDQS